MFGRPKTQQFANETFVDVASVPSRVLPWSAALAPMEHHDLYQNPWEARFHHRSKPKVEISSDFSDFSHDYARMLEYGWVARRTLQSDHILDVGSGESEFPARLAKTVASVVAVDVLDREAVHHQHMSRFGVSYAWRLGDARTLEFPDDSFDCVISISVIEHIPAPGDRDAVSEMVRVCKPGGRVLITAPYSHGCLIEDTDHPSQLQRYYTLGDLLQRFTELPGTIRDLNFVYHGLPEDAHGPLFCHPESASVVLVCFEKW